MTRKPAYTDKQLSAILSAHAGCPGDGWRVLGYYKNTAKVRRWIMGHYHHLMPIEELLHKLETL